MSKIPEGACELKLVNSGRVALVDINDYMRLARYSWRLEGGYVRRVHLIGGERARLPLSHAVLGVPSGRFVRFRNGDALDCRRANLRLGDEGQIRVGTSSTRRSPYQVVVSIDNKKYFCGGWPTLEHAHEVRRLVAEAARTLRGRGLSRKQIQRALNIAAGRETSRLPGRVPRSLEGSELKAA